MVTRVTKFEAEDGAVFDRFEDAIAYEQTAQVKTGIRNTLQKFLYGYQNPLMSVHLETLVDFIHNHYEEKPVF